MPSPIAVGKGIFTVVDTKYWAEVQAMGTWGLDGGGYPRVTFKRQRISLHKWIYAQVDPTYRGELDHRDTNPLNNLEENLRPCTRQQNNMYRGMFSHNTSGYKGVHRHNWSGKWEASLRFNGSFIYLGHYINIEEAVAVRRAAALRYFGEFAREDV